jgi:cell division protein FtsN
MKIKAILTIVISLLIGFVLGYLASGQVMKQEMKKRHSHSYHEMFVFKTLEVIRPSESQKDTLMPIIEAYAEKTLSLKNKVSIEFDSLMRQMSLELKPYVSEDQFKKLEENAERMKGRYGR